MKQSTKKIAAMVGGVVMFLGTIAPLAAQDNAQDNQPARPPYNPVVGQSATATVIQVFPCAPSKGGDLEITVLDVDGNPNTLDDQRIIARGSDFLRKNPQHQLIKGDKVQYIEDSYSILSKVVLNPNKVR